MANVRNSRLIFIDSEVNTVGNQSKAKINLPNHPFSVCCEDRHHPKTDLHAHRCGPKYISNVVSGEARDSTRRSVERWLFSRHARTIGHYSVANGCASKRNGVGAQSAPFCTALNTLEAIYLRTNLMGGNYQTFGHERYLPDQNGLTETQIFARIPLNRACFDRLCSTRTATIYSRSICNKNTWIHSNCT